MLNVACNRVRNMLAACSQHARNMYSVDFRSNGWRLREHIRWKPTPLCKLWKLQSEPHDVDPREDLWEVGGVTCKTHERWKGWFANALLQITPPTSHELSFGSTSCGSYWSFHSLHGGVGFHLIRSRRLNILESDGCGPVRWLAPGSDVRTLAVPKPIHYVCLALS
jgi:hypothetical protein